MNNLVEIEPEYVYVTIPAEYICVYHRILAMLADFGEDMLKDCKASCTDKNSGVIECFNMFNAAVAARKLSNNDPDSKYGKLARTLINYIKAQINLIYKGKDNSTSFVFPIDEDGQLKAFISCGELPKFYISSDDMELYEHKFGKGFDEHFKLGPEDESPDLDKQEEPVEEVGLVIDFTPSYEDNENDTWSPCGELEIRYDGEVINRLNCVISYYFDDEEVEEWASVILDSSDIGNHNFKVVVSYNNETKIEDINLMFNTI